MYINVLEKVIEQNGDIFIYLRNIKVDSTKKVYGRSYTYAHESRSYLQHLPA